MVETTKSLERAMARPTTSDTGRRRVGPQVRAFRRTTVGCQRIRKLAPNARIAFRKGHLASKQQNMSPMLLSDAILDEGADFLVPRDAIRSRWPCGVGDVGRFRAHDPSWFD